MQHFSSDNIEREQTKCVDVVKPLNKWSVEDVCKWLDELGLEQYKSSFETNAIDGTELEVITDSMLQQIGIGKQTSCPDIGPYFKLTFKKTLVLRKCADKNKCFKLQYLCM